MGNGSYTYNVQKLDSSIVQITCKQSELMEKLSELEPLHDEVDYKFKSHNFIKIYKKNKKEIEKMLKSIQKQVQQLSLILYKFQQQFKDYQDDLDVIKKKVKYFDDELNVMSNRIGDNSDQIEALKSQTQRNMQILK